MNSFLKMFFTVFQFFSFSIFQFFSFSIFQFFSFSIFQFYSFFLKKSYTKSIKLFFSFKLFNHWGKNHHNSLTYFPPQFRGFCPLDPHRVHVLLTR